MSVVIYNALGIRAVLFLLCCVALSGGYWLHVEHYNYLWFALPLALAEAINPLCFFIGIEKVKIFNIFNLIANFIAVALIFFLVKGANNAVWVNFILGMANVVAYSGLLLYLHKRVGLHFHLPSAHDLLAIGKANFSLTLNNISANLQQSVIFFALGFFQSPLLGAYSLSNKVIGQCRNAFNIVSNAVYPKAVAVYKVNEEQWRVFRQKMKYIFGLVAFGGTVLVFAMADLIVFILTDKHDPSTILILRIMAFVPIISAFNVFSMLDLILKQKRRSIFYISIILMGVATLVAFLSSYYANIYLIGAFTIVIEASAWLMYEYIIKKTKTQNA